MVSTLDFESSDPSSNLGGTLTFVNNDCKKNILAQSVSARYLKFDNLSMLMTQISVLKFILNS